MFKLFVLFALVAAAYAAPQILLNNGLISPLAYSSPLSYSAPLSYSVPAPYAYSTGNVVTYAAEPVEQHGYRIAY